MARRRISRAALTLVECMVALTVLSVALMAVSYMAVAGNQHLGYADEASRASRLAKDLVEEIVSKAYLEPGGAGVFGPENGETTRPRFDDVDDYHGYTEPAGRLADPTGAPYGESEQAFTRNVTVTATDQAVPDLGRSIPGVTVTVSVRNSRGVQWQVVRFIPAP
jgi:prepilin-type N-terminal cleavage/methylation domain-containing protein